MSSSPGIFTRGKAFPHLPALDGLRGLSIALVVAHHCGLSPYGFLGVDVFFVLSGFLITSLLLEEIAASGRLDLRGFYLRRALRLFPALYALLAVTFLITHVPLPARAGLMPPGVLVATSLYVLNWYEIAHGFLNAVPHCWSLSIEEQFYLLWPALVWLIARGQRPRRALLWSTAALLLLALAWQLILGARGGDPAFRRLFYGSETRGAAILAGCAVACLPAAAVSNRMRQALWISSLISMAGFVSLRWLSPSPLEFLMRGGLGFFALSIAAAVFALRGGNEVLGMGILTAKPLRRLGRISYSLYLVHVLFTGVTGVPGLADLWLGPGSMKLRVPLAIGLSLLAACISHYAIERPFLTLKSRLARFSAAARSGKGMAGSSSLRSACPPTSKD